MNEARAPCGVMPRQSEARGVGSDGDVGPSFDVGSGNCALPDSEQAPRPKCSTERQPAIGFRSSVASILPAFASPRFDQRHDGVADQRKGHDDHGGLDGVRTCHASPVCCKDRRCSATAAAVPSADALPPLERSLPSLMAIRHKGRRHLRLHHLWSQCCRRRAR